MMRSGNAWIICGTSIYSTHSGNRARRPGQPGNLIINILVTGHKGYIGSVLVPELIGAGYSNITGLDSDLYRESVLYRSPASIREIEKDIRDVTMQDLDGIDTIIHLAGLSNDPLGNLQADLTYDINLHATVRLANLARAAGVSRYIFSSTCSIYGASSENALTEDAPANPVTHYARSKHMAEQALSGMAGTDFCPVYLRSATAFGMSPKLRFDLVVNNLVAWACATGMIYLKSDGTAWRPLVHVRDIARVMVKFLSASPGSIHNQAFNIGHCHRNYQIIEIARMIENRIKGTRICFADDAEKDTRNYNVSFEKISRMFPDCETGLTVEEAIEELYDFFNSHGLTTTDFEGPRFNRIECIKSLQARALLDERLMWIN